MTYKKRFFIVGIQDEQGNDLALKTIGEVIELMSSELRSNVCNIEYGFTNNHGYRIFVDVGAVHEDWRGERVYSFSEGTFEAKNPDVIKAELDRLLTDGVLEFMDCLDDTVSYCVNEIDLDYWEYRSRFRT